MPDSPSPRSSWTLMLAVVAATLLARTCLPFIWQDAHDRKFGEHYYYDSYDYDRLARDMADGKGYTYEGRPSSIRAPGLPFLLAGLYTVAGYRPGLAELLMLILGCLLPPVIAWTADRLHGRGAAWIAGLGAALFPGFIYYSHFVMTELPCALFLAASFALLFARERPARAALFAGGLLLGGAILIRAFYLLIPPCLAVWFWTRAEASRRDRAIHVLLILLGCALPVLPWTIRNYTAHQAFVAVSTQGGSVLHLSYKPLHGDFGGGFVGDVVLKDGRRAGDMSEVEFSRACNREIRQWIVEHPAETLKLQFEKALWYWYPFEGQRYRLGMPFDPVFATFAWFWWVGLCIPEIRRRSPPALLFVGYNFVFCLVYYASPRFTLPVMPMLLLPAAAAMAHCWRARRQYAWAWSLWGLGMATGIFAGSWILEALPRILGLA